MEPITTVLITRPEEPAATGKCDMCGATEMLLVQAGDGNIGPLLTCVACWDTLCSPWPDALQEAPAP